MKDDFIIYQKEHSKTITDHVVNGITESEIYRIYYWYDQDLKIATVTKEFYDSKKIGEKIF